MFVFSDVLKLLEIHLRSIGEVQTVVVVDVILQKRRCHRALPLRRTWGLPTQVFRASRARVWGASWG